MNNFYAFLLKCSKLLYPVKIINKENLPTGGAILICNHFSAIDCCYIAHVSHKNTYFLAKSELFKNRLVAGIIKSLGGFPVKRGTIDLNAVRTSIDFLSKGNKVVIFPEGTRNKSGTDEIQPIKGGTAFISVKAKTPVVPLIIDKKAKIFRKSRIIVGKPFDFSEYYGQKISAAETEKMDSIVREKMIETQKVLKNISESRNNKNNKEAADNKANKK